MLGMEGKSPEEIKQMPLFAKDSEQDIKFMIGTGIDSLINRLSLGISSIFAGNSSLKLKKEIQSIADILFQNRILSKEHLVFKMSLAILLDSQIAKQQNPNQKSHDFTIRFDPPIVLDRNKNYEAALNELVTMSYSWYNIRATYGNNTLRWKKKSESAWKTITFPDGMFTYDDINSFMQKKLGKVGATNDELFTLFFDNTICRAVIILDPSIELDLSSGSFADLLGFEKQIYLQRTNVSKFVPKITRGVDWVFIDCDLITREMKNVGSDVLFPLPTSNRQLQAPLALLQARNKPIVRNRPRLRSICLQHPLIMIILPLLTIVFPRLRSALTFPRLEHRAC